MGQALQWPSNRSSLAGGLITAGIILLLLVAGREKFFRDPGTFWHIRLGERMLDTGMLIHHDPYTCTFGGSLWAPHGWLGEVFMGAIHRIAGFDGLLLASAAVIGVIFGMLAGRLLRIGLHPILVIGLVLLGLAAAASHIHARPHLITWLLFTLMLFRLCDFEAGRIREAGLLWLFPIFLVGVNCHGGVLGSFGTLGIVMLGWLVAKVVGWPSPITNRGQACRLLLGSGVIAGTVLVNPYGLELPRAWWTIMSMDELPRLIQEHAPLNLREPSSWPVLALAVVYLGLLAGLRVQPQVTWLLPIVWLMLSFDRVRHSPFFAITALAAIAECFPQTIWAARLRIRPDLYDPEGYGQSWAMSSSCSRVGQIGLLTLVGLALLLQAWGVKLPVIGAGWARLPETVWPLSLVPRLHEEAAGRDGLPIFNDYTFGGFLIYFAPEYQPFVDDRCELFGGPWLAAYVAAEQGDPTVQMAAWAKQYPRFDYALTQPGSGFDRYFDRQPDWERIAACPAGHFYRRRADRMESPSP